MTNCWVPALKAKYLGSVILLLIVCRICAAERTPAEAVHTFYGWYVHEVMNGAKPLSQERAEMRKFVTERLLTEIDAMRKRAEARDTDPFCNAREFDPEWGKNVAVGNLYVGRIARVSVILTGHRLGDREFKLKLVQENGAWKIDEVQFD